MVAQQMINAKLMEITATTQSPAYGGGGYGASPMAGMQHAGMQHAHGMGAMQGWGAAAYGSAPATPMQVTVPNDVVGKIIGKQGSAINEIRQVSTAVELVLPLLVCRLAVGRWILFSSPIFYEFFAGLWGEDRHRTTRAWRSDENDNDHRHS
jgi:hypothetical protein